MDSSPTPLPRAVQPRSRDTQQRILEAAVRVLGEQGVEGLTVTEVSAAAGVSVGSIYRRFGSKQQLLMATQLEFLRVMEGGVSRRLMSISDSDLANPVRTVHSATRAVAKEFADHAAQLRALLILGLQDDDIFQQGRLASVRGGAMFADVVLHHRAEIAHINPEAACDFSYRLIYATCSHRILQGDRLESSRRRTWEEVISELGRAVASYLLNA